MAMEKCTSCNAPLVERGATRFNCPGCGNEIRRCAQCREQSIAYTCEKCGYQGP
ncbi:MAG: zinc finger domain-containing protein [Methanofollis sp.]|uniref:zinc finger domain-containing protein n=1 Tax=Methanofollis sp. TaxID=2052835 RepID=UPI002612B6F3|nr:zinc finger domain-containing protein [Methanofollis sp.]MDD4255164.1 zinc finger domain-containing protein [Methanofollis sp.]